MYHRCVLRKCEGIFNRIGINGWKNCDSCVKHHLTLKKKILVKLDENMLEDIQFCKKMIKQFAFAFESNSQNAVESNY